jgi:hypothetical protein
MNNMPYSNMGPSYVSPASNVGPYASNVSPYASNVSPLASNVSPLASNVSPLMSNVSPLMSNVSPLGHGKSHKPHVAGAFTSAGTILVLYILLVIIARKF